MAKYKLVYDKSACIGAGECAKLSPLWKIGSDTHADIAGAKVNGNIQELEISDADFAKQKEVSEACPSGAIRLVKIG